MVVCAATAKLPILRALRVCICLCTESRHGRHCETMSYAPYPPLRTSDELHVL